MIALSTGRKKIDMDSVSETECLVFSTSLQTPEDVRRISGLMNHLPGITDWSVDLEDWEKVLRIEGVNLDATIIRKALMQKGIMIAEMPMD